MSEMKFTPAQQDAINAEGGSVIVSAAAGSGKTRVLVQRVIKMLTREKNPIPADRLLIVTFTNAAADEMKKRINSEIEKLIKQSPQNTFLRRQQILLMNADICTIHSFCSRLIKENFFSLDISQDFRIAPDTELAVIKYRIMSDIIEQKYTENTNSFALLSAIFSGTKNDNNLERTLLDIYTKCSSHPDMNQWIDRAAEFYNPDIPLSETIFTKIAFAALETSLKYFHIMLDTAEKIISDNSNAFCTGKDTSGENKLNTLDLFVKKLETLSAQKNWNGISNIISSFKKTKYLPPRSKKFPVSSEELQTLKICFSTIDDEIQKKLLPVFGISEDVYQNDTQQVYPAVCCMCGIIKEFSQKFFEKKKEKNILDFSDLEHLALKLLKNPSSDGKSDFAQSISQKYDAIMIDEFQDTNEIQDLIFRYISKNETNLFVVGDVKQSIYRFREAMPEIFKARRKNSVLYHSELPEFPACIILDKNFRSRENIIDSVNFVFGAVMSEHVGEIVYDDSEKLSVGAVYPPSDNTQTEIHLLDTSSPNDDSDDEHNSYEKEAQYIAEMIKNMLENNFQVCENGTMRKAKYSDFCILMRVMKSHSQEYADTMNRYGIPAYVEQPYDLFECYEVNAVISFFKAVDNRLLDIPMLTLLILPVFSFSPDDLAFLKSHFNAKHIYSQIHLCLEDTESSPDSEEQQYKISLQKKCRQFMDTMEYFRKLSVTSSISELAEAFFEKTGFLSVINAMPNGSVRLKNTRKFMSFVREYENGSKSDLSDFVRHIDYLEQSDTTMPASDAEPENAVKIISIHHSKGLEFPVCIMAGMNMTGNTTPPDVFCHKKLGFGMKMTETSSLFKYNTLQRNIIKQVNDLEELSEAMRILYVAMTRAKEKLIAVISFGSKKENGFEQKLAEIASLVKINDGKIDEHCVENAKTLGNWILMCAFAHPDMSQLRHDAGADDIIPIPTKSHWKYIRVSSDSLPKTDTSPVQQTEIKIDNDLLELLENRFSQTYKYQSRTAVPSKVSASTLAHSQNDTEIITAKPSFAVTGKLTSAEKGTAMHTFLQYADFTKLAQNPLDEKQHLLNINRISKEQFNVISKADINRFIQSQTYQFITSAERVEKEYRFTVNISAKEIGKPFENCNEQVILQGAMDCLAINHDGIIIIDYKTDYVKDILSLKERYQKQLDLYKIAAEQIFNIPVRKCIIYSTKLGQEIEV